MPHRKPHDFLDCIPALLTAIVWGSTYSFSQLALDAGLTPTTLMTLRFAIA